MKSLLNEINILFKSVPGSVVSLFVVSVVLMNLLANKSIDGLPSWLALDCGFTLSWLSFLCMDMITKHFGPRASIILSIFALLTNLLAAVILFLVAMIPGSWSASFTTTDAQAVNVALNQTFAGTWYVLLGSSVAFTLSSIINAICNWNIGKLQKDDSFISFAARSYISTALAQFVDNFTFALIVSHVFFGWTMTQCVTCAVTGMIVELICEIVFSPIGYKAVSSWKRDNVGIEYRSQFVSDRQ